jgi:hypothetical protein
MLPRLITEAEAGAVLRLRDRRTVRRHLADLGVGRVRVGRRLACRCRGPRGGPTGADERGPAGARSGEPVGPVGRHACPGRAPRRARPDKARDAERRLGALLEEGREAGEVPAHGGNREQDYRGNLDALGLDGAGGRRLAADAARFAELDLADEFREAPEAPV